MNLGQASITSAILIAQAAGMRQEKTPSLTDRQKIAGVAGLAAPQQA
jgi:hypothetical protein